MDRYLLMNVNWQLKADHDMLLSVEMYVLHVNNPINMMVVKSAISIAEFGINPLFSYCTTLN